MTGEVGPLPGELAFRRGLLALVAPAAVVAVFAGLSRLGLASSPMASRALEHGPLLVIGVFGTLIALERAVALGRRWSYAAPLASALAGLGLLTHAHELARVMACASGFGLVALNLAVLRRTFASFTFIMLLGSVVLAGGNLLWASGRAAPEVVPAWLAFFVLTIFAERLELSRLGAPPRWAVRLAVLLSHAVVAAAVAALLGVSLGVHALGAGFALLAVWAMRFDLARRTLATAGLPRFAAVSIMAAITWLWISGVALSALGLPPAGPRYDAVLHGIFVGFVLSMVFAHASIILPAVARVAFPFHRALYLPLAVLHAGLALRVAGDLTSSLVLRTYGGVMNGLALLLFVASALFARTRRVQKSLTSVIPRPH